MEKPFSRVIQDIREYNVQTFKSIAELDAKPILHESPCAVTNLYWYPNPLVLRGLCDYCTTHGYKKVLEVGPGTAPFPLATSFVGFHETVPDYIDVNVNHEVLPFPDKHFDFVYARHVLEDIQNPDFALKEMFRVSACVYIETPSPLIEMMRYIDGERGEPFNHMRGYMHHRYLVWSSFETNTIYFIPKLPLIEYLQMNPPGLLAQLCAIANHYPVYWNNYFLWDGHRTEGAPTIVMCSENLDILKDYFTKIVEGIDLSIHSTNCFVKQFLS